ncbi:hypothetical protein ACPA9J_11950 [Pseudomonas aeruginosa]
MLTSLECFRNEGGEGSKFSTVSAALRFSGVHHSSKDKADLVSAKQAIPKGFLESIKISVYIDDLDQRLFKGRKHDIQRDFALLNAIRDISTEKGGDLLSYKPALRMFITKLVRLMSQRDKTEGSVIGSLGPIMKFLPSYPSV